MSDRFDILNREPEDPADAGLDALRERAATVLEGALAFVEREGHAFSKLRAHILVQLEPVERGVDWLDEHVGAAGPVGRIAEVLPASLESALEVGADADEAAHFIAILEILSVLSDWGRLYEPVCDSVVATLYERQAEDGRFGPERSGEAGVVASVISTALTAGFLGRTRSARPEMLRGAGAYLQPHWSVDLIRQQGWPATAAFAHYYTNVHDEERDSALPWCGRELERGWLAHEYTPSDVMRVLFYCEASALPGVSFDANALLTQLFDGTNEDGSVGDPAKPASARVASTLDAMHFLLRICNAQG